MDSPMTEIVLLDEDLEFVNQMAKLLSMERPNWIIHRVGTAAEGVELIASTPTDVVVSDVRLPDMDGAEFLEKIRNAKPEVLRFTLSDDQNAEIHRDTNAQGQPSLLPQNVDSSHFRSQ